MSPNPTRTVFAIDVERADRTKFANGALEISIIEEHDAVTSKTVLFRARGGEIRNVSSSVTVTADKKEGARVYKLTKPIEDSNSGVDIKQRAGFDLILEKFGTKSAWFHGTMDYHKSSELKKDSCEGDFVATRDTDVAVIEAGQKPLPPDVTAFLDITPLDTQKNNIVQNWADAIFSDMCFNAMPFRAKELYYNKKEKTVGGSFNRTIPSQVSATDGYLSFANIARDNNRLFYLASMHILCQSLSNASWLEEKFKKNIWDHGKVKDFFDMIIATNDVDKLKNKYGNQNTAAKEQETLHKQHENALRRCYDAAYVCYQDGWQKVIPDPSTSFNGIETNLKSDQYKEHWLPTLANAEDGGGLSARIQLAIMQDKLNLLATLKAKKDNTTPDLQRVSNLIQELIDCTHQTGLVRESFIRPDQETQTKLDTIVFESSDNHDYMMTNIVNAIGASNGVPEVNITNSQVQSSNTNWFLQDEATPLGLYRGGGEEFADNARDAANAVKNGVATAGHAVKDVMVKTGEVIVNIIPTIGEKVSNLFDWIF